MKLVVIIPALNEEKTIARVLAGVPAAIPGIDEILRIVVDDGSTDQTAELARQSGAQVISHSFNRGVGAAFSTGINGALEAGADLIVNMDGDGQFNPADISKLIEPLVKGKADFVSCTRFAVPELVPKMPRIKRWGNGWVASIVNFVTGEHFTDVACGFRGYTRDTAMHLNLFGTFTYTQETFIDLVGKGVHMVEVPLAVRGEREFGKSRVASSVTKYALRAGTIILLTLRDNRPLVFFGMIGGIISSLGVGAGAFLAYHYLTYLRTSPYQSLVTVSALFLIVGFLLIVLALVADMLGRLRRNQEELLYLQKRESYRRNRHEPGNS